MTRNEAIHYAKCLKNNWTLNLNDLGEFCDMAIEALEEAKKREETWEWCTDCKEYDQENHFCHRWSNRIYESLCGAVVSGEWIPHPLEKGGMSIDRDVCSVCGVQFADAWMFNYCPSCGAYNRGDEDE
ncbi:MAG: hypothetical protein IKE92_13695 [Clostridiales bacterium]|nr:hypothetical protein [Clostridiales bacterium]